MRGAKRSGRGMAPPPDGPQVFRRRIELRAGAPGSIDVSSHTTNGSTTGFNTVFELSRTGTQCNGGKVKITLVGDSGGGVLHSIISSGANRTIKIRYEDGVSTVADIEAVFPFIVSSTYGTVRVRTPSTHPAYVLSTGAGDAFSNVPFVGGANGDFTNIIDTDHDFRIPGGRLPANTWVDQWEAHCKEFFDDGSGVVSIVAYLPGVIFSMNPTAAVEYASGPATSASILGSIQVGGTEPALTIQTTAPTALNTITSGKLVLDIVYRIVPPPEAQ